MSHDIRSATIDDLVHIDALLSTSRGVLGVKARRDRIRKAILEGAVFVCDQGHSGVSGVIFGEEMAPPDVNAEHAGWYVSRLFVDEACRNDHLGINLFLELGRWLRDNEAVDEVWSVSAPPEDATDYGQVLVVPEGGCGTAFTWKGATGKRWCLHKTPTAEL